MLSEAALAQPQSLEWHKEQLLSAEPVRATLARQRRVFRPSTLASQFDLPADFFNLTAEEIKREQRLRSEAVERLSVLRTKAMREREEQREMRKYTYTLLRVRLPTAACCRGPSTPGSGWRRCMGLSGRPCRTTGCPLSCWPRVGRSCRKMRTWPSTSVGWYPLPS